MIRREHKNTLFHGFAQFKTILPIAERRRHFKVRVVGSKFIAGEEEMMRRSLRRNGEPFLLSVAHKFNPLGGRNMLNMKFTARDAANRDIAPYRLYFSRSGNNGEAAFFSEGTVPYYAGTDDAVVKRMIGNAEIEPGRARHRLFHQSIALDITAVVGKKSGSRFGEAFQIGELTAGAPLRYARGRKEKNGRIERALIIEKFDAVAGWHRIGHRYDGAETASAGSLKSARSRLGFWNAGIAKVDVDIDKSGK